MTTIKICGITNLADALACVEAGADMLGFNFYARSPRYVAPEEARRITERLPPNVVSVGVFVNEESPSRVGQIARGAGVAVVQLHGDEPPAFCRALGDFHVIKALRVSDDFTLEAASGYGAQAILLDAFHKDAYGGTGLVCDWAAARAARAVAANLFLAGGLGPGNVADAIRAVRPDAVDACSSLERAPGLKDVARVRAFVAAVRGADEFQHSPAAGVEK
jgi:phosphoribosylanthranilate isomerase